MAKIFISYTGQDRAWAHWIAVTLRENGHEPFVHEWDIGAGQSIPQLMDERIKDADHLLIVLTNAYTKSVYSKAERWPAYWRDPNGRDGFIVQVEVEAVTERPQLAKSLKRLSLVGKSESEAEEALLDLLGAPTLPSALPDVLDAGGTPRTSSSAELATLRRTIRASAFSERSEFIPAIRPALPSRAPALDGRKRSAEPIKASHPDAASEVPSPRDSDAFEQWLRAKPREWAAAIAVRAALRVLPVVRWTKLKEAPTVMLPVFRASAAARFAVMFSSAEAAAAAEAAIPAARSAAVTAATANAAEASYAVVEAATAVALTDHIGVAQNAITAIDDAIAAAHAAYERVEAAIYRDAADLCSGVPVDRLCRSPLWPVGEGAIPEEIEDQWEDLRSNIIRVGNHWRVWLDWYGEAMNGSSLTSYRGRAWEEAFTDVPGALPWSEGPEAVSLAIQARLAPMRQEEEAADVPDQTPAPVQVGERGGKVAKVGDRESPLQASERDFNAWREPVVEHIGELTSTDFAQGTNHSRVRDRLLSLGRLLPGEVAEVKDRQFRIGYEIERFERLIAAYRSGGDDMPVLNAASLEDLDALRIALKMGVDKLERWAEFRRLASVDPKREGEADREAVAEAMDDMATDMERKPAYFDPELPASFRFLAEAVRDPVGATRTIVYGAVKSAENLVRFLGRRALGLGRKVLDEAEKPIPKAVAASLLAGLGGAALRLSGALPEGWAWLKPLLESIARSAGM